MNNKKTYPFLIRLQSVNKIIKKAFLLAAISILLIELILKNFNAPNETFYKLGDIYLKLCYSIAASSIFFFINQHLPKEEKKMKTYSFIYNKIYQLERETDFIIRNLKIKPNAKESYPITKETIQEASSKINPLSTVSNLAEASATFINWYYYLSYKAQKMKDIIRDLLLLNDALDTDLIERLLKIDQVLLYFVDMDKKIYANQTLEFLWINIYQLKVETNKASKITSVRYNRFWAEHSKRYTEDRLSNEQTYYV